MFNAALWCVLGIGLIVFANTYALRIPFARLSAGIGLYTQIGGILCILGSVFVFATRDTTPSPPSPWVNAQIVLPLGIVAGVAAAMWGAVALVSSAGRRARTLKPEFEGRDVSLVIDERSGVLHISFPNNLTNQTAALGRIGFHTTHHENHAITSVFEWPSPQHGLLNPTSARVRSRPLGQFSTSKSKAATKVFEAWVRNHPVLGPNWRVLEKQWETECTDLIRYCRDQRIAKGSPAVECMRFDDGPVIEYVAIEKDGSALAGTGAHPHLVTPVALYSLKRMLVVGVDGRFPSFELTDEQVRTLQRLQSKGALTILPSPAQA